METFKCFFICYDLIHFIISFMISIFITHYFIISWKAINHMQTLLFYNISHFSFQTVVRLKGSPSSWTVLFDFRTFSHLSQHEHFWISSPGTPPLLPLLYHISFLQLLVPPLQRTNSSEERQKGIVPQHCCFSTLSSTLRSPTTSNLLSIAHTPHQRARENQSIVILPSGNWKKNFVW